MRVPSGENARPVISCLCPSKRISSRPVTASNNLGVEVWSGLESGGHFAKGRTEVRIRLPSGENAARSSDLISKLSLTKLASALPVVASHSCAVAPPTPVKMRVPSGENNATERMPNGFFSPRSSLRISLPVATSHTRTSGGELAVRSRVPSGEKLATFNTALPASKLRRNDPVDVSHNHALLSKTDLARTLAPSGENTASSK